MLGIRQSYEGGHNLSPTQIVLIAGYAVSDIVDRLEKVELDMVSTAIERAIGTKPKRLILENGLYQATFEGEVGGIVDALSMRGFVHLSGYQAEGDITCLITFRGIGSRHLQNDRD